MHINNVLNTYFRMVKVRTFILLDNQVFQSIIKICR
mgnify:CR=1 FL=1